MSKLRQGCAGSVAAPEGFDIYLDDERISVFMNDGAAHGDYDALTPSLSQMFRGGARKLLIEKGGKRRSDDPKKAQEFGEAFGVLLASYGVRAAIIASADDHFESVVCYAAMKNGAKILATENRHEAETWIDGAIK